MPFTVKVYVSHTPYPNEVFRGFAFLLKFEIDDAVCCCFESLVDVFGVNAFGGAGKSC